MDIELIHIGFGNIVAMNRVVAIASPNSAPIKRAVQSLKEWVDKGKGDTNDRGKATSST